MAKPEFGYVSRANTPPRKVIIASAVANFQGAVDARLALVSSLLDRAAQRAEARYPGQGIDVMVFPEFAIARQEEKTAAAQAVVLEGAVRDRLAQAARRHHTWLVVPMTLQERDFVSNAAVLFNRDGQVAGIFRKVHPVADEHGVFEVGVRPGTEYPVFDCDFGKLGILICWDMSYEDAWDALAANGAEIVALPSASPQNLRPMAQALRHHFFVVNSAPRDNTSVFDPNGWTVAQVTEAPGVLVEQIDLSYAILHWSENLRGGESLKERFGDRVGYRYSDREDTGLFWSNDPQLSIGAMIEQIGLREMPVEIERIDRARAAAP